MLAYRLPKTGLGSGTGEARRAFSEDPSPATHGERIALLALVLWQPERVSDAAQYSHQARSITTTTEGTFPMRLQ